MKTLRLILLGALLMEWVLSSTAQAQYYGARRYPNRRGFPQTQPQMRPGYATPANTPPSQPDSTPPPAPAPAATNIIVRTQIVVRYVQPPVDPEKAKAAKEEAVRRTVEFQKKRADEGSESAQYELGMRYLKGEGVEKDEATGRKWLALSAKNGYSAASKKLEELDKAAKAANEEK